LKNGRQVGDEVTTKIVEKAAIMGTHMGLFSDNENDFEISVGDPVYAAVI
jgi:hypothetical protein